MSKESDVLVSEIYFYVEKDNIKKLTKFIIYTFDDHFSNGNFTIIDEVLSTLDLDRLNSQALFSVSCCASWAKHKLSNYKSFAFNAFEKMAMDSGLDKAIKVFGTISPFDIKS